MNPTHNKVMCGMKAIIQAGGLGTRLYPISDKLPKPLFRVRGKTILDHIIDFLNSYNIKEIGIVISKKHQDVFEYWLKHRIHNSQTKLELFVEKSPSGTFGWLRNLKHWLGGVSFVLMNGDALLDFDIHEVKNFHNKHKPLATIALMKVKNPSEGGVVSLNREGCVVGFSEKSEQADKSSFISLGFYILEPEILEHDEHDRNFVMIENDIFPKLAKKKLIKGVSVSKGRFYDCGTPERLEIARREW